MASFFSLGLLFFNFLSWYSWQSSAESYGSDCVLIPPTHPVSWCIFDNPNSVQCKRKSNGTDYIDVVYKEDHTQMGKDPADRFYSKMELSCYYYSNESSKYNHTVQFELFDDTDVQQRVYNLSSFGSIQNNTNVTLEDDFFSDEDDDDHPFVFPRWKFKVQVNGVGGNKILISNGTITRIGEVISNIFFEESGNPNGSAVYTYIKKEDGQCCHQHVYVKISKG